MKKGSVEYWIGLIGFTAINIGAIIGAFYIRFDYFSLTVAIISYILRTFALTAGFHRYFSHRAFKTGRVFQFIIGFIGTCSAQRGPIWWSAHHRIHHRYSDQKQDPHSPSNGVFQSHIRWIFMERNQEIDWRYASDWKKYPELLFIDKFCFLVFGLYLVFLWTIGTIANAINPALHTSGIQCLFWAGIFTTVIIYHITFSVNSLCHIVGSRPYNTPDTSRNFWPIGLLAFGEGWHNNHHHYSACAQQGFKFWQIDISYMMLKTLSLFNIVWGLKPPPSHILKEAKK